MLKELFKSKEDLEREKRREDFLYPETAKEASDRFEKGENVFVVELGGFGPGYEHAIWIAMFKVIKSYHKEDMKKWVTRDGKSFVKNVDDKLMRILRNQDLTGAQFEVIKHTSYHLMRYGWREMMKKALEDRVIQVNKNFLRYDKNGNV